MTSTLVARQALLVIGIILDRHFFSLVNSTTASLKEKKIPFQIDNQKIFLNSFVTWGILCHLLEKFWRHQCKFWGFQRDPVCQRRLCNTIETHALSRCSNPISSSMMHWSIWNISYGIVDLLKIMSYTLTPGVPTSLGQELSKKSIKITKDEKSRESLFTFWQKSPFNLTIFF